MLREKVRKQAFDQEIRFKKKERNHDQKKVRNNDIDHAYDKEVPRSYFFPL